MSQDKTIANPQVLGDELETSNELHNSMEYMCKYEFGFVKKKF